MRTVILSVLAVGLVALSIGCSTAPKTQAKADELNTDCLDAIAAFKKKDPSMEKSFFKTAHGYAVFPKIGKGGLGVGGAGGKGQVYENGNLIGYTTLSQGTIGLQIGGQAFREIVFFKDKKALDSFTKGEFAMSAQATAVAAAAGASATADYSNGVAVFVGGQEGLMAEASIGGQKFSFEKLHTAQEAMAKD